MTMPKVQDPTSKALRFLNADEAKKYGFNLDPNWEVQIDWGIPGDDVTKLNPVYISPDKWEFSDFSYDTLGNVEDYKALSPEGKIYSKFDLETGQQAEKPAPNEDISGLLLNIFPEQGLVNLEPEQRIKRISTLAETDFEGFITDIQSKGDSPDTRALLRAFQVADTDIDALFGVKPVSPLGQALTQALPDTVKPEDVDWAEQFFGKNPAILRQKLIAQGRNPTTEAMVRQQYPQITDKGLGDYFKKDTIGVVSGQVTAPWTPTLGAKVGELLLSGRKYAPSGEDWDAGVSVFGQALTKVPKQLAASILQAIQGQGGASVVDKDWADRLIESANTDIAKFTQEVKAKYGETSLPINLTDLTQLPQNIAFSLTSMGAGLGVGLPVAAIPLPGARVAAWALGTAASGAVAYSMTTYQIMQQYLELKNEESLATKGRGITAAEEKQLKADFDGKARAYGLWEAMPEAISNLAFAKLLTTPLMKMGLGKSIVAGIINKLTGLYGEELLTETLTQKGQSAIEVEAGLREGRISWAEAFKEIAPQTFLLTTILGGAGQIGVSATNKIRNSLKTEIGEGHPLFKTFLTRLVTEERGAIGGEKPAEVPKEPIIPKVVPPVPVYTVAEGGPTTRAGKPVTRWDVLVNGKPSGRWFISKAEAEEAAKRFEEVRTGIVAPAAPEGRADVAHKATDTELQRQLAIDQYGLKRETNPNLKAYHQRNIDVVEAEIKSRQVAPAAPGVTSKIIKIEDRAKPTGVDKGAREIEAYDNQGQNSFIEYSEKTDRVIIQSISGGVPAVTRDLLSRILERNPNIKEIITSPLSRSGQRYIQRLQKEGLIEIGKLSKSEIASLTKQFGKQFADPISITIPKPAPPQAEAGMAPSTSVQTGLAGMGKEAAQVQMFGEVSGKEAGKVPLTEVPKKAEAEKPLEPTVEEVVPPPPPPPQSVTPPPVPIEPKPTGGEITRIITQTTEQVRQDKVGSLTKLFQKIPGIRQILEFEQPGIKMTGETEKVLTAMVAENAARSDVSAWAMGTRMGLLKDIRKAFGKDSLKGEKTNVKFIGTEEQAKNPITGTLKDIADNPELYELSNAQQGVLAFMEGRNDQLLDYVVNGFNAEIGRFQAKEGGAFLPNVDVSEDVVEYLKGEMRAVVVGRGKTRIWQTARDRMAGKTPFKPELDVQKLLEGLDNFKASAAGGQTYRAVIGGLTRLEAMETTHPELFNKMMALRKRLQSLQGSAGTIESNVHKAIFNFLNSPVEGVDLLELRDSLDVKLKTGVRKGMDVAAIQDEIASVREDIKALRPAWEVANLKPYVFIQEGIYRYFPSGQAKLIVESRKTTNNPALNFIEGWRGQAFSGDFSPFTIQGVIGVLADPWGSLTSAQGAIRTATQTHDWLRSVSIEALADDVANNPYEWSQFASLMGRGLTGTPREYAAGFLSKIPGFDKFTETTYLVVTRGSFNLWQRTYRNMVKHGIPELEAKVAAANHASKVYPLVSAVRLGQSQARTSFLRAMPTSYSFIRQPATLMAEAVNGLGKIMLRQKLTPQESLALKTMITLAASVLGVAATSAAISAKAKGGDDDDAKKAIWDAINPDPHNGKFASLIVGNVRIPIGGPYRAIFRAVWPQKVEGLPIPLPFVGLGTYIKNRISPAIGTQIDLILNKDYSGNQIIKGDFPENILRFLAYEFEGVLPLTLGSGVEAIRQGEKYKENIFQQMIGQFMGANPVTLDNTYLDRQIRQLGLPKDTEPTPYSIQKPDLYNSKDLFSDARWTKDLTIKEMKQQGFDKKIIAIAEAREIKKQLDIIPSKPLIKINSDPAKGDTFIQYAEQWGQRQRITDEKKLAEFDKQYPDAYLGNMSQNEYVLLRKYYNLTDAKQQADFLKEHPELTLDKRNDWLKSHPKENALLALHGQAKILTLGAYQEVKRLIKELDYPDDGIPPQTLPPETSIDTHFAYQDMVAQGTHGSWEASLLLKRDALKAKETKAQSYADWQELKLSDTPIASLELKTIPLYHEIDNKLNKDTDPDWIGNLDDKVKDANGLTARDRAANALKDTKIPGTNLTYRDMERKVTAVEKGSDAKPIDKKLVDDFVAWKRMADAPGVGSNSAEPMLARVDNPALDKFLTDKTIWANEKGTEDKALDPIDSTKIAGWRIDAKYRAEDKAYQAILDKYPERPSEEIQEAKDYLAGNEAYRKDRRRREAYKMTEPKTGEKFPNAEVENYVAYNEIPNIKESKRQERFIIDNPAFAQAMYAIKGGDIWLTKPETVPNVAYDDLYDKYKDLFDEMRDNADFQSKYYIQDKKARDARDKQMFAENPAFKEAFYRRKAYGELFDEKYVENYVTYILIPEAGYANERYLKTHPDFYQYVKKKQGWKEDIDFAKIPSEEVENLYNQYQDLQDRKVGQAALDTFREQHLNLEDWLLLTGKVTVSILDKKRRQGMTPKEKFEEAVAKDSIDLTKSLEELRNRMATLRR